MNIYVIERFNIMAKAYILYNPLANSGNGADILPDLDAFINDEKVTCDMTSVNYKDIINSMGDDDYIVICGGDGTLNRFVNAVDCDNIAQDVLYYASGTGNDFATDLGKKRCDAPFSIKKYLTGLPSVTVNGNTYKFINGVGYGIDGYCCEEGDNLRASGATSINYTSIAIKGLLGKYKPTGGSIIVDGVEHKYKKIWIAPTMHGRFYGGGMNATPAQNRENGEGILSVMSFHDSSKLKTLMIFPNIFKGEHVKKTKNVSVFTGKEITVKFDAPRALQIDGETILGVTEYTAIGTKVPAVVK